MTHTARWHAFIAERQAAGADEVHVWAFRLYEPEVVAVLDAACAAAVADIAEVVEQDHLQITPADGSIPHAVAEDMYRQGVKRLANAIRVAQAARARTPPPGGGAGAVTRYPASRDPDAKAGHVCTACGVEHVLAYPCCGACAMARPLSPEPPR